ncbi:Glutamyl-tRNA(Gln) amidotransferase subunit C [Phycisphaerales bacterium]|nr:Glutamyl-tRNA(Gln) amidotransferase subunit C [Phycisphaerales bacterium]
MPGHEFSDEYIRKLAKLSRLTVTDAQSAELRTSLSTIVTYVERLRRLDLDGVEPLANVGELTNRLDDDQPGPTLPPEALRGIAPEMHDQFLKVPKVLGDGGGA